METSPLPKRMMVLAILDILRKYSDAEHKMSQQDIVDKLESDYGMATDRKTLRRNLDNLIDYGYDIEYTATERRKKNGSTETLASEWYINHEFTESELRLLIDGLLFSKQIPTKQKKSLIEKLRGLASKYFRPRTSYVSCSPDIKATNKQLFFTIEILDEAISRRRKVSFNLGNYDIQGKMLPRNNEEGSPKEYTASPYQIAAAGGRYYVICNYQGFDTVTNTRLDRILNIQILDEPIVPIKSLPDYDQGFNFPKHMAEHIYMTYGKSVTVRFRCALSFLIQVFDWFGNDVEFRNTTDTDTECVVKVDENAMLFWALQFGSSVEVLEPKSLRERLLGESQALVSKYLD